MTMTNENARMAAIHQAILTLNFDVGTIFSDDVPIAERIAAMTDEPTDNACEPRLVYEGRKVASVGEFSRTIRTLRRAAEIDARRRAS